MNDLDYNACMDELDEQEIQLSEKEEQDLAEFLDLQQKLSHKHNLLDDLGKAALQGVEDYLNSFIDTSEIMSDLKNPDNIRDRQSQEIEYNGVSADKGTVPHFRKLSDAKESPYCFDSKLDNSQMSDKGRERLTHYEKSYKQRLKTVGEHKGSNKLNDPNANLSLAGIRSYQFGPTVSCYTADEYKQMWEKDCSNMSLTNWIRTVNYNKLDAECYKEFGFSTSEKFSKWRRENKLTPHETPEGIFLVPNDVHHNERHAGLQSAIHKYIEGKLTKEELNKFERDARVSFVRNECKVRGVRAVKGAASSAVKVLVQKSSAILVSEVYFEFKAKKEDSFFIRIERIVKKCYERFKKELGSIWDSIIQSSAYSVGMELFTALNDFVFKTAKNILKIIRAMIGSIIRALKIISSSKYSWQEKIYEALKILTAGFVAAVGFSLNDIIKTWLVTIPPLVPFAPFIADVFSGLFASIMSSLVLSLFDSYKKKLVVKQQQVKQMLLADKVVYYELARTTVSDLKANVVVAEAVQIVHESMAYMTAKDKEVETNFENILHINSEIEQVSVSNIETKNDISTLLVQFSNFK